MCSNQKTNCHNANMKISQFCCCIEKSDKKDFNKKHIQECIDNLRKKADYMESKLNQR